MYCMMHCNRVESTELLVVDVCVQGMIGLAHNHISFKYIYPNTDFVDDILKDDRVCLTCYKSHLVIVKENQPNSKDEDLKVLIDNLGRQAKPCYIFNTLLPAQYEEKITTQTYIVFRRKAYNTNIHCF